MNKPLSECDGIIIPDAIVQRLQELRALETSLGHLPPEEWAMAELTKRINDPQFPQHATQMEEQTGLIFSEVCVALQLLSLDAEQIAKIVNSHVGYVGGPKYCDGAEVRDVLS